MKTWIYPLFIILNLLILISLQAHGQNSTEVRCYFGEYDSVSTKFGDSKGTANSENGWILPASGTLKVLVVFAEIDYTVGSDPVPSGTSGWPVGDLPIWADDLFDTAVLPNPHGLISKYYRQASSGNFNVIGDYLVSPFNNGVFRFPSTGSSGS